MVGKLSLGRIQQRLHLHHAISRDSDTTSTSGTTRGMNDENKPVTQHVPFIASPLDPKVTEWLKNKHSHGNLTLKRRPTVAQQEAHRVSGGLFRKQHEASPLELFFDLFFVANLAVFTYNHTQADGIGVADYVGFFSILWTFWFHISIYDVRFYVDSILNRFFKLVQFIMFVSLCGLGAVYDVLENGGITRAFHGLALVMMMNRLILMVQYAVILWFVRPFKKTVVPLLLMMLIYLCSAMAFLGTYLYDPSTRHIANAQNATTINVWYVIIGIEAILVVVVSSIWRVLSFKHTHLVERVGLLTLIVMGEGIIGICKSVAYILDGTTLSIWDATGRVIAGVLLIYLVFVLYFTPIAHDRFGTIRQQIWVLLHLPLHIAIVLTEEGSAATLLWTAVMQARQGLIDQLPSFTDPSNGYPTIESFITKVNATMNIQNSIYTYLKLSSEYNWYEDLNAFKNISDPYASTSWNEQATEILGRMLNETTLYFFENFNFEAPYKIETSTNNELKLDGYYDSEVTIFSFFYISSGCLLLTLAAMFWIGKNNKTWEEWISIGTRTVVGLGLPFVTIAAWVQPVETGFMSTQAGWIISIVTFAYLFVVIIDNIIANIYDKRYLKKVTSGEISGELEDLHKRRYNGAFGPHVSTPNASTPHLAPAGTGLGATGIKSTSPGRKAIRFEERSTVGSSLHQPSRTDSNESDGLVSSNDSTLHGRRDSENNYNSHSRSQSQSYSHRSPPAPRAQSRTEREWQDQPSYYLPTIGRNNSGYGRLDTEYRGYEDQDHDHQEHDHMNVDVERGENHAFVNDQSFEEERMMSPATYTNSRQQIPDDGYLRPGGVGSAH